MTKQFLHELTREQFDTLFTTENMTFHDLNKLYREPAWCTLGCGVDPMGCWGLMSGFINDKGEDYCKSCEYYNHEF